MFNSLAVEYGNGDRKLGKAMEKVSGTVQRVDNPGVITSFAFATFFGKNAVLRIGGGQNF